VSRELLERCESYGGEQVDAAEKEIFSPLSDSIEFMRWILPNIMESDDKDLYEDHEHRS
jgi:hypothetical protein